MTIKEIEELSGMTRANIRFYEAEGLLSPAREENGYRDYSEENLAILKRIKLLRSLHIPLEEGNSKRCSEFDNGLEPAAGAAYRGSGKLGKGLGDLPGNAGRRRTV